MVIHHHFGSNRRPFTWREGYQPAELAAAHWDNGDIKIVISFS